MPSTAPRTVLGWTPTANLLVFLVHLMDSPVLGNTRNLPGPPARLDDQRQADRYKRRHIPHCEACPPTHTGLSPEIVRLKEKVERGDWYIKGTSLDDSASSEHNQLTTIRKNPAQVTSRNQTKGSDSGFQRADMKLLLLVVLAAEFEGLTKETDAGDVEDLLSGLEALKREQGQLSPSKSPSSTRTKAGDTIVPRCGHASQKRRRKGGKGSVSTKYEGIMSNEGRATEETEEQDEGHLWWLWCGRRS
ncbi:hypothetical protein C8J57DRAFT_1230573 [Mycena rebaudengoi]|nr:hypothetical protein C8J57DRAFT_1230573 [Mycena rebaudengoi]